LTKRGQKGPRIDGMPCAERHFNSIAFEGESMNQSFYLFLFFTLIFAGKVLAKEEIIATITNDENPEIYTFVAQTDEATNTIKAFFKDDYVNGKKMERELLPSRELNKAGVVLEKRGDHTIINIKSEDFDYSQGGMVTIDTLYNGINGTRKEYDIQLAKSPSGWRLFRGDKIITRLHIEINKKALIGAIGVKNIKME